jgi:hypothetical protein
VSGYPWIEYGIGTIVTTASAGVNIHYVDNLITGPILEEKWRLLVLG